MTDSLVSFIEARMPLPGVAAWSIRGLTGAMAHGVCGDRLSSDQLEPLLTRLALAAESLRQQDFGLAQICWVFSEMLIFVAPRADGGCLALFVADQSKYRYETVQTVMQEFLEC
jgi:hypothetical protein